MKATRTFLLVLAAAAVAGCTGTSSLVAPPDSGAHSDAVQPTSSADTAGTAYGRGVHLIGGGN